MKSSSSTSSVSNKLISYSPFSRENQQSNANLKCYDLYEQVVFEGIVGRGHQSDVAIDEVKIENCGEGGGGQGKFLLISSVFCSIAMVFSPFVCIHW